MKNKIVLLACILYALSSNGQKVSVDKVPDAVKTAFIAKYPSATKVEWEMEDSTTYEAEFKMNKAEYSACFNKQGQWLQTEKEIKPSALPAAVSAAINKEFPGYKIEEAEEVETPAGTVYEVELEKGETTYEVQFSADGTIIKKELENESKKDSDND